MHNSLFSFSLPLGCNEARYFPSLHSLLLSIQHGYKNCAFKWRWTESPGTISHKSFFPSFKIIHLGNFATVMKFWHTVTKIKVEYVCPSSTVFSDPRMWECFGDVSIVAKLYSYAYWLVAIFCTGLCLLQRRGFLTRRRGEDYTYLWL